MYTHPHARQQKNGVFKKIHSVEHFLKVLFAMTENVGVMQMEANTEENSRFETKTDWCKQILKL